MVQTRNMSINREPLLIRFFDPSIASLDSRGRTLATVLSSSDRQLEASHDYIQTLFPLPEGSMFNSAPLITPEIREAFLSQPQLRASLRNALERMLAFYGLQLNERQVPNSSSTKNEVTRGPNFTSNSKNWVTRFNHNHLRITRILRSLRVLGLTSEAEALHDFLASDVDVTRLVSERSQMYWRRATHRELYLPPDEEDRNAEGIAWLRGS